MANHRLPFNLKREIYRWGPLPGRNYYSSDCFRAIFFDAPKKYPKCIWPKTLFLLKGESILWLNDSLAVRNAGIRSFKRYMISKSSRLKLRKNWGKIVKELNGFEKRTQWSKLETLSNRELYRFGTEFFDLTIRFWTITIPQELGNYGSDYFLEQKLKNFVPDKEELARAMEILTAPEELSFYQKEELDLFKTRNIQDHQSKYFWIHNSYNQAKVLSTAFFLKRKKQLQRNLDKKFSLHIRDVKQKKKTLQKKYHLPPNIMNIAEALSFGIAWQDERKGNIFKYIHFLDLLGREIARRRNYNFGDLLNADIPEVISAAVKDIRPILKRRVNCTFGYIYANGRVQELGASSAKKYWRLYGEEKIKVNAEKLSGVVASRGGNEKISGQVKIVRDPFKVKGFRKGSILVSPFTSPEYLFLMKKAAAIIADFGGLTSHAAITSRELGIPCVVGTKVATKVLRDGDLVEVDAKRGAVKLLSR